MTCCFFCNNGNCLAKNLFSIVWHNFVVFSMTFVNLVASSFVVRELLLVFFFFPLLNRSFQGFSNITISYCRAFVVILTFPKSSFTFFWTLILPWQSLLVFSLFSPIAHGSLSKLDVS